MQNLAYEISGAAIAPAQVDAAYFVNEILHGTAPGELPVEFPTKMTLSINLKTAKALGITVPPALLSVADEVIE